MLTLSLTHPSKFHLLKDRAQSHLTRATYDVLPRLIPVRLSESGRKNVPTGNSNDKYQHAGQHPKQQYTLALSSSTTKTEFLRSLFGTMMRADRDLATWLVVLLVFYSFPAFSGDLLRDAQAVCVPCRCGTIMVRVLT